MDLRTLANEKPREAISTYSQPHTFELCGRTFAFGWNGETAADSVVFAPYPERTLAFGETRSEYYAAKLTDTAFFVAAVGGGVAGAYVFSTESNRAARIICAAGSVYSSAGTVAGAAAADAASDDAYENVVTYCLAPELTAELDFKNKLLRLPKTSGYPETLKYSETIAIEDGLLVHVCAEGGAAAVIAADYKRDCAVGLVSSDGDGAVFGAWARVA
ncbi:MAG: hypothetical protein LBS90_00520 [Oscillospiraceae bacterium]|jgi:hypothetical protein|nr:hypothetical protein [Oscillospiraceae bacterium]